VQLPSSHLKSGKLQSKTTVLRTIRATKRNENETTLNSKPRQNPPRNQPTAPGARPHSAPTQANPQPAPELVYPQNPWRPNNHSPTTRRLIALLPRSSPTTSQTQQKTPMRRKTHTHSLTSRLKTHDDPPQAGNATCKDEKQTNRQAERNATPGTSTNAQKTNKQGPMSSFQKAQPTNQPTNQKDRKNWRCKEKPTTPWHCSR
jgi:hypothetical protein